ELRFDDQVVNDLSARDRDIAMVFQSYALYPHMTVRENIEFPLKLSRMPKSEIQDKVAEVSASLGLDEYLDRKPAQLSGGQRQRVAMGRAIVRRPKVFLMDEPLSNLDAKLRVQMRAEIAHLQQDLGVTTVYVTHDQTEAMTLGDRVVVMRKGVIQQVGSPDELYASPTNLFVASFIGSPSMNFMPGRRPHTWSSPASGPSPYPPKLSASPTAAFLAASTAWPELNFFPGRRAETWSPPVSVTSTSRSRLSTPPPAPPPNPTSSACVRRPSRTPTSSPRRSATR